jgi:hypothetical protein
MVAKPHSHDRRRKRSRDPLVALHYQLAQARQDGGLDAIVVSDDSGIVVAGAGAWAVCEELAAHAPLLVQGVWNEPGLARPSRMAELAAQVHVKQLDIKELSVDGQTVLLCARAAAGRGKAVPAAAMEHAARGIARILTEAA